MKVGFQLPIWLEILGRRFYWLWNHHRGEGEGELLSHQLTWPSPNICQINECTDYGPLPLPSSEITTVY